MKKREWRIVFSLLFILALLLFFDAGKKSVTGQQITDTEIGIDALPPGVIVAGQPISQDHYIDFMHELVRKQAATKEAYGFA